MLPAVKVGDHVVLRLNGKDEKAVVTRVAAPFIISTDPQVENAHVVGGRLYEYSGSQLDGTWRWPETETEK